MCFRIVQLAGLAVLAVLVGSGSVEIAQVYGVQSVGAAVGLKRVFEKKFRCAVGIDWLTRGSSVIGMRSGTPYTAQVGENTKRRMPASSAEFRRVIAARTLL